MRRRLLIAGIFLLAGAVVNVAVAWGCAAWAQRNQPPQAWQYDPVTNKHWSPFPGHLHWHSGQPLNLPDHSSTEISQWWAANAPGAYSAEPITAATSSCVGVSKVEACTSDLDGLW